MSFSTIVNDFSTSVVTALSSVTRISENGIKRILVPTDFSEYSDMALQLAIDLARQQNAKIILMHVLRSGDAHEEREMMQRQIARFPDIKDIEIVPEIRKGKIHKEILNAEAEDNADLIILSRHRRGNSLLSLLPGIATKVRRAARSSVLVVGA
jgi:universal stress protein A